jgi:HSP20 family molecular chaperone IbpA
VDGIEAKSTDGLLEIRCPKEAEQEKASRKKQIEIK